MWSINCYSIFRKYFHDHFNPIILNPLIFCRIFQFLLFEIIVIFFDFQHRLFKHFNVFSAQVASNFPNVSQLSVYSLSVMWSSFVSQLNNGWNDQFDCYYRQFYDTCMIFTSFFFLLLFFSIFPIWFSVCFHPQEAAATLKFTLHCSCCSCSLQLL